MVDVFVSMGHPVPVVRTSGVLRTTRENLNYLLLVIILHTGLTPEDSVKNILG